MTKEEDMTEESELRDQEMEARAHSDLHDAVLTLIEDHGWTLDNVIDEVVAVAPEQP